ncbi:enoyl-CoA hydratase/isomerase family protein [Peterkaempfera bronchialis]|uniref:Enoyl-CoA hydratase/isomerase family protein n=1 Tax=Peterkaempfera bronchialis TaxID=2126346 RepID=A0A345SR33_9ACTN|nr:enoyl-CoA hydratase/isomerase family protein [Peterkaempfera bronchialis]AXI76188.1 enoyl-CoA hydratase/isomerase family protein [Peterkaempfera bronchialis]
MSEVIRLSPREIAELYASGLDTDVVTVPAATETPRAADVLTIVDLDGPLTAPEQVATALRNSARVLIGIARHPLPPACAPVCEALTLTVSAVPQPGRAHVLVDDPEAELDRLIAAVDAAPRAALALAGLLRLTATASVRDGLVAESLAYSALLGGPEFAAWRAARPARRVPPVPSDVVLLERADDVLRMTLNRPDRRNALGHGLRDGLIRALELVLADTSLKVAELRGEGASFCSGGDLDEFGSAVDPASAHVVRLSRSAGWLVHRCADRVRPYLHGACVGAGMEVPAFADIVVADPGAWFMLPERSLGLVPGAGGTVSVTRRIGPWRTAWMTLTGDRVTARRALEWGLVDRVEPCVP